MSDLVLGIDPAWGGLGWCLVLDDRPLASGWSRLARPWREAKLVDLLSVLGDLVDAAAATHLDADDPRPRVVVELAPPRHKRRTSAGVKVKNPGPIAFGLGLITGSIMTWATREGWLYPWGVPPGSSSAFGWRSWWGYGGRARNAAALKQYAVWLVNGNAKRRVALEGFDPREPTGPAGDVAEATLIALGGAKHNAEGPRGPRGWSVHPYAATG